MWYIIVISVVVVLSIVIRMLTRKSATGSSSSASSIPPSIEGVETSETETEKEDNYDCCGRGQGPYYC